MVLHKISKYSEDGGGGGGEEGITDKTGKGSSICNSLHWKRKGQKKEKKRKKVTSLFKFVPFGHAPLKSQNF